MSAKQRAYLVLILTVLMWGSLHTIGKLTLREVTGLQLAMLRPTLACPTLLILAILTGKSRQVWHEARATPGLYLLLGFLGPAASSGLTTLALQILPAGVTSLLSSTSPIMLVLGATLIFGQIPPLVAIIGAVVGLIGVALLTLTDAMASGQAGQIALGVAMTLVSSACWASYTALLRRMATKDPVVVTAISSGAGALFLALIALPTQDWSKLTHASGFAIAAILWMGIIATAAGNTGWSSALRILPASAVTPFVYLVPVTGLFIANRVLGEPLTVPVLSGAALVLLGVALSQAHVIRSTIRRSARQAEPTASDVT